MYLDTVINSKNILSEEIKSRIAARNRCLHSLEQIFRPRAMSKTVKMNLHKTMVKPDVVYISETWPMTGTDVKILYTWDRKILRINSPVVDQGIWRTSTD